MELLELGFSGLDNEFIRQNAFYLAFLKNTDSLRPNSDFIISESFLNQFKEVED